MERGLKNNCAFVVAIIAVAVLSSVGYSQGVWTTLDYPGADWTNALDIEGDNIVGAYGVGGTRHGFIYDGTNWTPLDYPGADSTTPREINNGNIVGDYSVGGVYHGFLYDGTNWTPLDYPGADRTFAFGVDGGNIVGQFTDTSGGNHGFIYDGTSWAPLDYPGADSTEAWGIEGDNIVGYYYTGTSYHGFLYDGTNWTPLDYPGAGETSAESIDGGNIIGRYSAGGAYHSYLYDGTNWINIDFPSADRTNAYGIDGGNIVGWYKSGSVTHGFLYEVPEPECGWIAFMSNQDGDNDIWAIRADGTGLRQLTNLPGAEFTPEWSPDSTKIAYCSFANAQLWVYDWFGGTNTKIYDAHDYEGQDLGSFSVAMPAWSPDGSKILFREEASYNNPHITVINADGTGRQIVPVQSGYVSIPSWSPSGTAFVYERRNSGASYSNDLWIYDFTATGDIMNGNNIRLTQGASSESTSKISPDWRPSGDIILSWGHNLAVIDPGQSPQWGDPANPNVTFLTNNASYPSLTYWDPSWSPDLSQIVYWYHHPGGGVDDLWIMDADGGNRNPLTSTPYREEYPDWGNPVCEPTDPVELLVDLAQDVIALNLQQGISNSLDAKLDAAMQALDDINESNDVAAINTLQAFINAVEAQRGNKIPEADADALIAVAQEIINLLSGS